MEIAEQQVVTPADAVNFMYERADLDDVLLGYAQGEIEERLAELALGQFSHNLAELAYADGTIDVDMVRAGFDRLTHGYNVVANEVVGPQPAFSVGRAVLETLHVVKPRFREYYGKMDDRYWDIQFMEQFKSGSYERQQDGEPEKDYFARYLRNCIQGFSWANFTYIRGWE